MHKYRIGIITSDKFTIPYLKITTLKKLLSPQFKPECPLMNTQPNSINPVKAHPNKLAIRKTRKQKSKDNKI